MFAQLHHFNFQYTVSLLLHHNVDEFIYHGSVAFLQVFQCQTEFTTHIHKSPQFSTLSEKCIVSESYVRLSVSVHSQL